MASSTMQTTATKKRKAIDDGTSIDNAKHQKTSTNDDDAWETKLGGYIFVQASIRLSYTDATGKHGKTFQMKDYDMNEAKTRQAANTFIKENKLDPTNWKMKMIRRCQVRIQEDGKVHMKSFGFSKSGGPEQALAAAKEAQRELSDKLERTRKRLIEVPESDRRYITAFVDGDGCVAGYVYEDSKKVMLVSVSQSQDSDQPEVLKFIQSFYGGNITVGHGAKNENQRKAWVLNIYGPQTRKVLLDIAKYGRLKAPQARIGIKWLDAQKNKTTTFDFNAAAVEMSILKEVPETNKIEIDAAGLTEYDVCGLMDAEGCVWINGSTIHVQISQVGSINYLKAIKEKYRGIMKWTLDKYYGRLTCHGENAELFVKSIIEYSHGKRTQLQAALDYRNLMRLPNSTTDQTIIDEKQRLADFIGTEKKT